MRSFRGILGWSFGAQRIFQCAIAKLQQSVSRSGQWMVAEVIRKERYCGYRVDIAATVRRESWADAISLNVLPL